MQDELTGRPVRCPDCQGWQFSYTSDRSGNNRVYTCKKCKSIYLAVWKGEAIVSALREPQNTKMEDWSWSKLEEPKFLSIEIPMETTVLNATDKPLSDKWLKKGKTDGD